MKSTRKIILIACILSAAISVSFCIGVYFARSSSSPNCVKTDGAGLQYSLPKSVPASWFTGS